MDRLNNWVASLRFGTASSGTAPAEPHPAR